MANRQSQEKTRAEEVRTRRQESRKQSQRMPFGSSATRKNSSRRAPVTRLKVSTPPVINHHRNKVRVPLKQKRAELQLPASLKLHFGWRLVSGAVFILSLAIVISFSSLSAFEVSTINLEGAQRLDAASIFEQLDIFGESIIKLQPENIAEEISNSFPSLSGVQVFVGLPASVRIKVIERQPLVLWQQENQALWIDAEGVLFPIRGDADVPLTVIASSDPPGNPEASDGEVEDQMESLTATADEMALSPHDQPTYPSTTPEFVKSILSIRNHVPEGSNLQYDPLFGLGWQDPRGWMVYFGKDADQIDVKITEYDTIVAALHEKNLQPALISVEYMYAPFYRLEQ